jgi:hypothetical protein
LYEPSRLRPCLEELRAFSSLTRRFLSILWELTI